MHGHGSQHEGAIWPMELEKQETGEQTPAVGLGQDVTSANGCSCGMTRSTVPCYCPAVVFSGSLGLTSKVTLGRQAPGPA